MGYTDTLLADGEVVARQGRQHWLALLLDSRAAIAVWVLAALLFVASAFFRFDDPNISNVVGIIVLILVVLGLLLFAYRWLSWINQSYIITNRRILKVEGILNKRSADSSLEKINDLRLEENLLGRMLGYGDLDIITASDTAIDRFRMLRDAKDFKKVMLDQKHRLESGEDIRMPGPPLMAAQPSREPAPAADREPAATVSPAASAPAWQSTPEPPAWQESQQEPPAWQATAQEAAAWQATPQGPGAPAGSSDAAVDPADEETRGVPTVGGQAGRGEAAAAQAMSTGLPGGTFPAEMDGSETGRSGAGSPDAGIDDAQQITQTLTRLADLRDRGAINSEEYEAKKAELLSRL